MIEKELKSILSKEQYNKISEMLNWEKDYTQVNYYFDSEDKYCLKNATTVRIRYKNEKYMIQVKVPIKLDQALHIKKEFEKSIPGFKDVISGSEISFLTGLQDFPTVAHFGSLSTRRKEYSFGSTLICLDYNEYNDIKDYEVEIEFENEPDPEVMEKLFSVGVLFDKNVEGKFTRFYNSLNDHNIEVTND